MKLTPQEIALIKSVRAAAVVMTLAEEKSPRKAFDAAVEGICQLISTSLLDASGDRPGSWEAEIGRKIISQVECGLQTHRELCS